MRGHLKPIVAAGWLLLVSCSSSTSQHPQTPDITPEQEVQHITDLEKLETLQDSLTRQLADKDPTKAPTEFALLGDVNRRLVELHTMRLKEQLDLKRLADHLISDSNTDNGVVPLPDLERLKKELANNKALTPALVTEISLPINREENTTNSLIKTLEAESKNPELSAERRATVYHQLYLLSGDAKWQEGRDKQMDVIVKAIHAADDNNIANKSLEDRVDFVRRIYTEEPAQVVNAMQAVYANIFARRFSRAHAKGNPQAAFEVLQDLVSKPDYEKIKKKLQPVAAKIAADYATHVAASIDLSWNLAQSFDLYEKEVEVRRILGLQPQPNAKIPELTRQLFTQYKNFENKPNPFAALGVLYALATVDPEYAELGTTLALQHARVRESIIQSVSVAKFRSRYEELGYGDVIASFITQNLLNTPADGVRILEQSSNSTADDADAIITGSILEAKVDASQTRNKKLLQVTVGKNVKPNPAYITWLELSGKERAKSTKPNETIEEDKKENVYITSTLHRKVAIFAVSYRLMTAKDNRVVFPDSITLQAEYEDESSEGLEVGELVIPYKVAKLPTDTEILHKLSQQIADVIAGNLLAILQNQETEYLKMADKFAAQNNCSQEVENLAKAVTLLDKKEKGEDANKEDVGKESNKVRHRLIERTLTCF